MEVTAYDNGPGSTGKTPGNPLYGITASGTKTKHGTIAAPPAYTMDTKMYVPGYGLGSVQDRGKDIQGNRLDVWFPTAKQAYEWGRKHVTVTVCK